MKLAELLAERPAFVKLLEGQVLSPYATKLSILEADLLMRLLVFQHCPATPVGLVGARAVARGAELVTLFTHDSRFANPVG